MKRFLKFIFRIFLVLIIAFVIFFFWASSSTLDKSEYAKLIEVDNHSLIKRIVICGPESTGKTTMTNNLAVY